MVVVLDLCFLIKILEEKERGKGGGRVTGTHAGSALWLLIKGAAL